MLCSFTNFLNNGHHIVVEEESRMDFFSVRLKQTYVTYLYCKRTVPISNEVMPRLLSLFATFRSNNILPGET
jgi:hypothetical protein